MEAGSYKILGFKLLGVVIGLVVMLSGAAMLTRSLSRDSATLTSSANFMVPNSGINNEITIMTDSGRLVIAVGMTATRRAVRKIKLEYLRVLIRSRLRVIYALDNSIRRIEKRRAIPVTLRQNILTGLKQQLVNNQKKLSEIERYQARFSAKIISLRSTYSPGSRRPDVLKKSLRRVRKKSFEARYWI